MLKGYDSIKRYCGRLEDRLKDIEGHEGIVDEIKSHLQEQADAHIADGCVPEIAELLAIEDMGPVPKLAGDLKKYSSRLPKEKDTEFSLYEFTCMYSPTKYTPINVFMKNMNVVRLHEGIRTVLVLFYISSLWIYIKTVDRLIGLGDTAIRLLVSLAFAGVIAFSLFEKSRDRYKPFFTPLNITIALLSAVLCFILYDLFVLLFFEYGFWAATQFIGYTMQGFAMYYLLFKSVSSTVILAFTAYIMYKEKENGVFTLICAAAAFLPLTAVLLNNGLTLFIYIIMLIFICGASLYMTNYCKSKYWTRTWCQIFGVLGCSEIIVLTIIRMSEQIAL